MTEPTRRFDPYAIVRELERARVFYVVIGGLARVLQGSDEVTQGLDVTPSLRPQNLTRLVQALTNVNARRADGKTLDLRHSDFQREPVIALLSDAGEIKIVPRPAGTRGYDDLRHRALRQPIGEGLRPEVAATGDLVRMLEARGGKELALAAMRQVVELERGIGLDR